MRNIAEHIKDQKSVFILGKGTGYPIALEGALKIKVATLPAFLGPCACVGNILYPRGRIRRRLVEARPVCHAG